MAMLNKNLISIKDKINKSIVQRKFGFFMGYIFLLIFLNLIVPIINIKNYINNNYKYK